MLGKLPVPGRPANLDEIGQGPIALAFLFSFSLSL